MISEERKRKLSKTTRNKYHSIDVDIPSKRQKKSEDSDEEDAEDSLHSVGKNFFTGIFTWLFDAATKNYFVESAMSAFKRGIPQNGRNMSRLKSEYQIQLNEEENEPRERPTRFDLKRTPLRESYKKSQNYLTLLTPSLNQRKSNFDIRSMDARTLKRSSNALVDKKVIEHPFRISQKFRKADLQNLSNFSMGRKVENGSNDHSGRSLFASPQILPDEANSERTAPSLVSNRLRLFTNALCPPPKVHVVGNLLYKKKGHTAEDVMALHERDQYKLVLESFSKWTVSENTDKKPPTLRDQEIQTNPCGKLSSELSTQQAFNKQTVNPSVIGFITKYFKGYPTYGIKPDLSAGRRTNILKTFKKSEKEDDVIISEVKMPEPRSPTSPFPRSPCFSPEWISELQKSFNEETEKKVRLIREQEEKIEQYRELRAARLISEDKALEQLRVTGSVLPEAEVEDTSIEFPELTPVMEEIIDDALNPEPPEEVLCVGFNISVSRKDIETLAGLNWLNDEIIYFYMNLLMERSKNENYPLVFAFNTFFYPKLLSGGHAALKRWTRKMDIFSFDLILVPVHMGMHWCLAVIDFRSKKIRYYDSMGGQNTDCLYALRDYLKDECKDKKKENFDMSGWVYENVKNIPHQMNGSDCGMFTLKYAEYITRDAKITFTQDHMQYFRRRMVYEILTKQLL